MKSPIPRVAAILVLIAATSVIGLVVQADDKEQDAKEQKEFADIVALMKLSTGETVADIGAGGGSWTLRLARSVGPEGRVFTTEIREHLLEGLRALAKRPRLEHVTVLTSGTSSTALPDRCCDAVLLRLVYHAFRDAESMRLSLRDAVKPKGRVLIIDFAPTPERLSRDMEAAGFERRALVSKWQGDEAIYAALFERIAQ
jgi:ubiquinone/menaquinone biosynthesis C-methylase UbiE